MPWPGDQAARRSFHPILFPKVREPHASDSEDICIASTRPDCLSGSGTVSGEAGSRSQPSGGFKMQPTPRYFLVLLLLLLCVAPVHARDFTTVTHDVAVPAGTLLECTLSEPKLSSATTSVGDPFLCYPRNLQEFGQPVFPRGAYLVGHLEDAKEPGHFVGKGYLKMEIDRIGLPTTDIPLRAKVISV